MIPGSANPLLLKSAAAAGGLQISRSLRFNSADSAYLSRTPAVAGNRKTWTWSGWVKRSALGVRQNLFGTADASFYNGFWIEFFSDNKLRIGDIGPASLDLELRTTAAFRDSSAWAHLLVALDTPQPTSSNRVSIYWNGAKITAFDTASYPTQNFDSRLNTATAHGTGRAGSYNAQYLDGYLANIHFIDGQALDPSSFTETDATTGQLIPKTYTGTYGTNGFNLLFADNSSNTASTLGKDTSGNGNNWTPNNFSVVAGAGVSVAAASGALPVFNTTDTYGAVKGTGTRTDSNSSTIVLAIAADAFSDQSATIKGSGSAKTVTANGDTVIVSNISKYYGSSCYLDGSGDSLTVPAGADFAYGTGDFTHEGWFYQTRSPEATGSALLWAQTQSGQNYFCIFTGAGQLISFVFGVGGGTALTASSSYLLNTWNHFAIVRSGTTLYIYVNGVGESVGSCSFNFTNTTFVPTIGLYTHGNAQQFQGYIQDFRVYKGVAKYTSNFIVSVSPNNLSVTAAAGNDSLVDSPTNYGTDTAVGGEVRGNYCTWNPLAGAGTLSNGNLDCTVSTRRSGTVSVASGKWYWEITLNGSGDCMTGIIPVANANYASNYAGVLASEYTYYSTNGQKYTGGTGAAYGATFTSGDIIGAALDLDTGTIVFYKNGVSQGTAFSSISGTYTPVTSAGGTSGPSVSANFGQRAFAYPVSGFKALCTQNLPAPLVTKSNTVFDVLAYSGSGASRTFTGFGFGPDLVWIKQRSGANNHRLYDVVRGATKALYSNLTNSEGTDSTGLTSFTSDGFTLGDGDLVWNASGQSYVAWTWDAGTSTVSNTQGSITSQVRANATAGFSVVTYTGTGANATVGHGLGVAPGMVIVKRRDSTSNWQVRHTSIAVANSIQLNLISAAASATTVWNSTAPSSTVFSIGTDATVNGSGGTYVAYCFAPVVGYSSFGSYTGNGSTDGPFVYTGFRPRWVMIKRATGTTGGSDWLVYDALRPGYNLTDLFLKPNTSDAEQSGSSNNPVDLLSNGFKLRWSTANSNASGDTFIYAAFAESPFNYSRAR